MSKQSTHNIDIRESIAIQFAKVVPTKAIRERNNAYWQAIYNIEALFSALQSDLITRIEAELPAKLNYDAAVALREGSYIRGQDYKVEGYNKAITEVRSILATYKGEE